MEGEGSLAGVEKRGRMKAIVGRMFALIHYRPWPTSTVVSYFEQIVIRRRLRSVNQRDWRRVAALRVARGVPRSHASSRPFLFFSLLPPPPLVNYSTAGKQLYPFDRVNCTHANTRLEASFLDGGWWVEGKFGEWSLPFEADVYKKRIKSLLLVLRVTFTIIYGFPVT